MKRFISLFLALVMCSALMISAPALADDEPYAVQLLLPTMQAIPAAEEIKLVEDAINDHIKNDLAMAIPHVARWAELCGEWLEEQGL